MKCMLFLYLVLQGLSFYYLYIQLQPAFSLPLHLLFSLPAIVSYYWISFSNVQVSYNCSLAGPKSTPEPAKKKLNLPKI